MKHSSSQPGPTSSLISAGTELASRPDLSFRQVNNFVNFVTVLFISIAIAMIGCNQSQQEIESMPKSNEPLLREIDEAGLWFHAKKTRPIWVRQLKVEEMVPTIEGDELVPAGNYVCRGEAGDIWPQSEEPLKAKYKFTDERDEQGWLKCVPRPEAAGVMAAQVPHAFKVHAKWGTLSGKSDDFIVKNVADRNNPNPTDVWIVDQRLFNATYERVATGQKE